MSVENAARLEAQRFRERSAESIGLSQVIEYRQDNQSCAQHIDRTAFGHKFASELEAISELQQLVEEAEYHIHTVYTYRSYSQALPMIPTEMEENSKRNVYKEVFDILSPQINKIKNVMEFHDRLIRIFVKNMRLLAIQVDKREPLWKDHLMLLVRLLDCFGRLDLLKDMKGQMKNDFARYKRTFAVIRGMLPNSADLMAEITAIFNFLNDPQHPYHIIIYHLKEEVKNVPQHLEVLNVMVNETLAYLANKLLIEPEEKYAMHRAILTALYLADDDDPSGFNVFRNNKPFAIRDIKRQIATLPILPVFMDMKTTVPLMLSNCTHWNGNMEREWTNGMDMRGYDLVAQRTTIQDQYTTIVADFVSMLNEIRAIRDRAIPMELQELCFDLTIQSLRFLGEWTSKVREQVALKYDQPCTDDEFKAAGGTENPAQIYQQATQYNYGIQLKYALVEIIGLIKGFATLLAESESTIRPVLAAFVHDSTQEFVHKGLLLALFRAHKAKKGDLADTLLTIRLIGGDTFDVTRLRGDYQVKNKRELNMGDPADYPKREVFMTPTQVFLVRRLLFHTFSSDSPGMKGGLFATKDLNRGEVTEFEKLYNRLFFVSYVANLQQTIRSCSDLSSLWFREFYLNLTKCIQFPIDMSLPWMLTDFAMNTPSLAPNVFFPLSVYNDCAELATDVFKQQFLFDELEAEVNLVFDQLIFSLKSRVFDYYKNKASKILLDKPFTRIIEQSRTDTARKMRFNLSRYENVITARHIQVLGRTLDVQALLTEHLNNLVRDNVDVIISRLESGEITSVMEIESLLNTLRLCVDMIRESLPGVDSFDDVLDEINDDTTLGSFRGRLVQTVYNFIFTNLLRKYVYNQLTQRFVNLEGNKPSKKSEPHLMWGSRFTHVYRRQFQVTRSFFGVEHLQAIIGIMGIDSLPLLVDEVVRTVAHIIVKDISPYVGVILNALDPMRQQPAHYGVLGVYGYYDLLLQHIKAYAPLRDNVFGLLREAGNALCFVQLLDMVLTHESYFNFQVRAFYQGFDPARFPSNLEMTDDKEYSQAATALLKPRESPFIAIMRQAATTIESSNALRKEFDLLQACMSTAARREDYLQSNSGGWLFTATLDYLYTLLEMTGLLERLRGPKPKNGIIEAENPKDFARFWSVATFIYLVPDYAGEELESKTEEGFISDEEFFGDGWLWAGTTILFLTNLAPRYRLFDPTIYIDKLQRLYPEDLTPAPTTKRGFFGTKEVKVAETERYKPFVKGLLAGWKMMERKVDLIQAVLSAHYSPLDTPIVRFSPHWEE